MSETNEASVQSIVHTPRPWRLDTWNGWLLSAEDVGIVKFDMNRVLLADAKLMAAAPDLLAACMNVAKSMEDTQIYEPELAILRSVIRKAVGEQV